MYKRNKRDVRQVKQRCKDNKHNGLKKKEGQKESRMREWEYSREKGMNRETKT
jgi:hypothetical protein